MSLRWTSLRLALWLFAAWVASFAAARAQDGNTTAPAKARAVAPGAPTATPEQIAAEIEQQQNELWEYSPYRVRVWLAVEQTPLLSARKQQLQTYIQRHAEIEAPASWILTVREAPVDFRSEMLGHLDRLEFTPLLERHPLEVDDRRISKLLLISVREQQRQFVIQAREVDCRTQRLGGLFQSRIANPALLGREAFRIAVRCFSPLARIVRAKGNEAKLRLRAGGLIVHDYDPARLDAGGFLLPIVRNNDRYGKPRPGGILVPPWTFLQVLERRRGDMECRLHSGLSNPVGGRSNSRKERLALGVSPAEQSTQLLVQTRTDPKRPLAGFDIYAKNPITDAAELIGRTDWRGSFEVPQEGPLLRIIYVRSGGILLARLPMVPGLFPELVAETVDDSIRLRAEGFVKNMQSELMDLVARRMLTATRLRKKLEEGDFDAAQQLLDEYKKLPNRKTLADRIRESRSMSANADSRTRRNIDRMYSDLDKIINKFLNAELQEKLARELTAAKNAAKTSQLKPTDADGNG